MVTMIPPYPREGALRAFKCELFLSFIVPNELLLVVGTKGLRAVYSRSGSEASAGTVTAHQRRVLPADPLSLVRTRTALRTGRRFFPRRRKRVVVDTFTKGTL